MMKLKSRYKSFVSSLKKIVLKLKEKAVLCTEQSKPTTQIDNEITDISAEEIQIIPIISFNCFDLISAINKSIQDRKNTIAELFYSAISINKSIKIDLLTSIFDLIPKYNIQTHSIYHSKWLFI